MSAKIEIEELQDGFDGDLIGLFAEGEWSHVAFLEAARAYLKETYQGAFHIVEPVQHGRWRRHPRGEEGDEMKPGRGPGSFLVTHVKVEWVRNTKVS